jgi:hypothetical protein
LVGKLCVTIVFNYAGQGNKAVSKPFVHLKFVACNNLVASVIFVDVVASVGWLRPLKVEVV